MTRASRALPWILALAIVAFDTARASDTTLRLTVPPSVASHAARRASGDATARLPILVLEGVEEAPDEALEITVLGPPGEAGSPRVLAVTGSVGSFEGTSRRPVQKVRLIVPLNEEAAKLLAGRDEVTLTLRVADGAKRRALKFERAFFREP